MKVGKFWAQNLHLGRNGSPETLIDLGRDSQWLQDNHTNNSNKEKLETKKRRIHISFQMSPVMNEPFSVWQALFSAMPPHQQDDDAKISLLYNRTFPCSDWSMPGNTELSLAGAGVISIHWKLAEILQVLCHNGENGNHS